MDDATTMGGVEGSGDLGRVAQGEIDGQRPARG